MKPKTFIPLVLGVVVGGAAIKMVIDVVSNAQAATKSDMATCVVAKVDIQFAEEITPEKLKQVEWPKSSLPESHFANAEALTGRVSDMLIPKDVPIYGTMLAPDGTPPGIQVRIKPGYRAVAVPIDEVSGVSYQVKPGDRVDVVALVKQRAQGGGMQQSSRIILQNVEVATVGRQLHTNKKGETVKSAARSVTLLLRPDEVTRLHMAQSLGGKLSLALRGMQDQALEATAGATPEILLGQAPVQPRPQVDDPAPRPRAKPVPAWNVKVISGNRIEDVHYRWMDGRWELGSNAIMGGPLPPLQPTRTPIPPRGVRENTDSDGDFDSAPDKKWAEES